MAEFHGIFSHLFLPLVLLIEGWVEGAVAWGGMRGGKNRLFGHPMSSHDAHTLANDTPLGHIVSGVPTAQLVPSMGAIVLAVTLEGRQNAFQKSRPVNI